MFYGNTYQTTIPSCHSLWEALFIPSIFHRDPDGKDGSPKSRNSHKPHAVIADGAAMQRVPGSMRFLQKTCEDAGVPLFIVNDPRVWGGNTHQDLEEALRDMRKAIKYEIVKRAMRGSAFSRGRLIGQLETEASWKAKEMGEKTRAAIRDANRRLQKERRDDWSQLTRQELTEKLVQHKVIKKEKNKNPEYTPGMVDLAEQCSRDQETVKIQAADDNHNELATATTTPSPESNPPGTIAT